MRVLVVIGRFAPTGPVLRLPSSTGTRTTYRRTQRAHRNTSKDERNVHKSRGICFIYVGRRETGYIGSEKQVVPVGPPVVPPGR